VVDAAGRLFGQLGGIANGLYSLALNYIRTDNDMSVDKLTQTRLPESGQPECDMDSKRATVPEVIGRTEDGVDKVLAAFWPQGNPGKLRQAADDWHTLATRLETVANEGDRIAHQILAVNRSQGIDGFATTWRQLHGDGSGGKEPLIPAMKTSCQRLETACRTYADRIDKQREDIRNLAIAAGIGGGVHRGPRRTYLPAKSPKSSRNPNMTEAFAYQRRVAGGTEYNLYTTVPRRGGGQENINADGVRTDDGAAIEAQHVGQRFSGPMMPIPRWSSPPPKTGTVSPSDTTSKTPPWSGAPKTQIWPSPESSPGFWTRWAVTCP
jgi:restriction endonuclease fold toxin 2 of polymorphic toxin system